MSLSARLAIESPRISVDVVNIAVVPYLAIRHGVDDIPTTVANGKKACIGVRPEEAFVRDVLRARTGAA